jgi:hypothetical protein
MLLAFAAPAAAYPVVISEVQTFGDASPQPGLDEYVELFNVSDSPVTLTDSWILRGGNGSCTLPLTTFAGEVIPPRKHLLVTGSAYNGSVAGDASLSEIGIGDQSRGNPAGAVMLTDGETAVDTVGFLFGGAGSPGDDCFETAPAVAGTAITGDASFARGGADQAQDTEDNYTDFTYAAGGSPQNLAAPEVTAAPQNRLAPTISGTARSGEVLAASSGVWQGGTSHSYEYFWRRCDAAGGVCTELGAGTSSYSLTAADVGATIRVRVQATNTDGSASAVSAQTTVVQSPPTTATTPQSPTASTPATTPKKLRCVVPKLKKRTLRQARKALKKANCRLGKVKKRRTRRRNVGKVLAQDKRAGTVLVAGAKVRVVVGRRR